MTCVLTRARLSNWEYEFKRENTDRIVCDLVTPVLCFPASDHRLLRLELFRSIHVAFAAAGILANLLPELGNRDRRQSLQNVSI
jgi:hypothetical protein